MKLFIKITMAGLIACALPSWAQNQPTPPDLPPTASARQWIEQDPSVVEARSGLREVGHTAAMLNAGPHEWTARLSLQRRGYQTGGPDSREWNAQLERAIRVNGKAGLDREIGEAELVIAEARVGEAIHEAAKSLLDLWIDGLAAVQSQALLQQQHSFAQANLQSVERRRKAGDASALDVGVATSDAADVERQASQADTTLAKARAKLRVRFPEAKLPTRTLGDPAPPAGGEAQWLARVLDAADPLRIAQGQLRKAELKASRAAADRIADPTVSLYTASEFFRQERIVGVSLSIPLGGTYRSERAQQALQEAETARAAVDRQRRELETAVAETHADAIGNLLRWQSAEKGRTASGENARLTQRAYSLGEADLQSVLLARRQSLEASRAALDARVEALRANYRLLVDAHLIWDLSTD